MRLPWLCPWCGVQHDSKLWYDADVDLNLDGEDRALAFCADCGRFYWWFPPATTMRPTQAELELILRSSANQLVMQLWLVTGR